LNSKSERLSFAKKIQSAKSTPDGVISDLEQFKVLKPEFTSLEVNKENVDIGSIQREL